MQGTRLGTHLKFIETENRGISGKVSGNWNDRVSPVVAHGFLGSMNTFVYVNHECVEVHAPLACHTWGQGVVEEVHEHGLASSDIPI